MLSYIRLSSANIIPKRNPAFYFIFIVHNAKSSPGNCLAQDRDSKEEVGGRCNDTACLLGYGYKMPPKVCAKEKAKKKFIQWSSEDRIMALAR